MKNNRLWQLFLTFLKIGGFTFGGGYAMIPFIKKELVEKKAWIEEKDILDIIAIAESTPGPIAINAATFVGYKIAGFFGALISTIGIVLPSFFIILGISFALSLVESLKVVEYAFWGIRAGVLALIVNAFFTMYKQCPKKWFSHLVALLVTILVVFTKVPVVLILILCGIMGFLYYKVVEGRIKHDLP